MALGLLCLVGVGISATILYVHHQIDRLGDGYTSFCSVNDSINCDRVLSSSYAKVAGIPVAAMGLVAYLVMAALFLVGARSADDRQRATLFGLGAAGVIGSLVFSGYMAVVAVVRLETLCLLCMGLYAVAIANTVVAISASRGFHEPRPMPLAMAAAIAAASILGVSLLGWLTWPRSSATIAKSIRTADDVRQADPDFYKWFTALPKVAVTSLLREEQAASLPKDKVVVVDFFDLECAHCKKNYLLTKELAAARAGQVLLVHRHFPLDATCNDVVPASLHPNACRAAEAVECAGLQGKHDEMLDVLFRNQGQLFRENILRLGGKIGLDDEALQKCLDEHRTLPSVLADARAGARLEITSTPTVFVGGRRIKGVLEEVAKYEMAVVIEATPGH